MNLIIITGYHYNIRNDSRELLTVLKGYFL